MKPVLFLPILFTSFRLFASDFVIDTFKIYSGILNENRTVLILKPTDLLKNESVKLLFMPDGEFSEYRYNEIIKDSINNKIVGIGIINTKRNRDLLPVKQADKFLAFLADELVPIIEKEFVINGKILFGHSFAGAFTLYSMINEPALFDKYIISSPTPIMNMIEPTIYTHLDSVLTRPIILYFSYGSEDLKQVRKWAEMLDNNISGLQFQHIKWKNEIFEGENHNSSDKIAIRKGLEFK